MENFQKMSDNEHAIHRPDLYIGSITTIDEYKTLVLTESHAIESKKISYNPGLMKIFDEIISNALDNTTRSPSQTYIKVQISPDGWVSVENDGNGIPIEKHESGVYVPEMIFTQFRTSSNYDDSKDRYCGG